MPKTTKPPPPSAGGTASTWMEISALCLSFSVNRMQADLQAQRDMMTCTSPEELMRTQMRYCQEAAKAYADHAAQMVSLMSGAMSAAEAGKSPFSRKFDDVPV